jgi:transcription initiation factor IIE alpha subunit
MLEELFSDKNTTKVIEHFIIHEKWDQNQKELCEELQIYQRSMRNILQKLVSFNIIKVTRQIAKSKLYRVNESSPLIKPLRVLLHEFISIEALSQYEESQKEENQNLISNKVELNHGI